MKEPRRGREQRLARERLLEFRRFTGEMAGDRAWYAEALLQVVDGVQRALQRTARRDVEADGEGGKLAEVADDQRSRPSRNLGECGKRDLCAAQAGHAEVTDQLRSCGVARIGLNDHAVLVCMTVDRRDLALCESAVQHIVDGLQRNAELTCPQPVDADHRLEAFVLLEGADIRKRCIRPHGGEQRQTPSSRALTVSCDEGVLMLIPA